MKTSSQTSTTIAPLIIMNMSNIFNVSITISISISITTNFI